MPPSKFVTLSEFKSVQDDVLDLKGKDAQEDKDIKELRSDIADLKRLLGSDEEIKAFKEGADRGGLAFTVLCWAGGLFIGSVIIAVATWMIYGGMSGGERPRQNNPPAAIK